MYFHQKKSSSILPKLIKFWFPTTWLWTCLLLRKDGKWAMDTWSSLIWSPNITVSLTTEPHNSHTRTMADSHIILLDTTCFLLTCARYGRTLANLWQLWQLGPLGSLEGNFLAGLEMGSLNCGVGMLEFLCITEGVAPGTSTRRYLGTSVLLLLETTGWSSWVVLTCCRGRL